jgi:hypothetical protein
MSILGLLLSIMASVSCTTTRGTNYAELAVQGIDVFAGKNWNAPEHNNMYDRWEFSDDGTFHFWHIHEGTPLDRGVYRYEVKDSIITIAKEGDEDHRHYAYVFSGNTVTLTPVEHHGATEHEGEGHEVAEHADSGGHHNMGALPEAPVTFTHAK